ncbi:MAG: cupin domain-containing protein [Bdellovibrionales bacterium]|nr:cupin domain-containing protein [Bdellovibrionales bacterium]
MASNTNHNQLVFQAKAHYFKGDIPVEFQAPDDQTYFFKTYIGKHKISVERGDCVYYFSSDAKWAHLQRGPVEVDSQICATVIRGYMPSERQASLSGTPLLPYINGCSTRQIFAPPRLGDPTLQLLMIPAGSSEQAHHIHSTVRVVYVLQGRGMSIVGMPGTLDETELTPGMVCILDPMCPHHFTTPFNEDLVVVPLHIFSSVPSLETNHPMYNGTFIAK